MQRVNAERLSTQSIEAAALDRLFERGLEFRIYLGPVVFLTTITWLAWDAVPWRRWILLTLVVVAVARLAWVSLRARREGAFGRDQLHQLLPIPATMIIFVVATSGGVDSPLTAMLPLVGVFLSMFLRPKVGTIFASLFGVAIWVFFFIEQRGLVPTFIPEDLGGGARLSNDPMLLLRACLLTLALAVGAFLGWVMRKAFHSAIERALEAREETLVQHRESTQTLTTLAAEIAHELKNPLASVKGLAALVDRDAEGKDKERLTVLRREVDRMQEILDSFLTFSRPLVPLSVGPVPLRALVEQVVALHEGVAVERGLEFRVDARDVSVAADHRKLQQVLINLVQNAVDVTPRGGAIDLIVRSEPGGAAVLVQDRGPGVTDPQKAFEPGVTTKDKGSGLGLTVARQLARQHGGELSLLPRDGGGTIAELKLLSTPAEPT
ncbi:MAG: HAMP domain-containing sensor histidine kinase [Myxococcaceae bacterium]